MSRRSPTKSGGPRWDDIIKSSRSSRRKPLRTRRARRGGFYAVMILAILALFATAAFAYVQLKLKGNSEVIAGLDQQKPNTPMNVLVLGSDSRSVLPEEEQQLFDPTGRDRGTGRRADTIILIHLDEQRSKAVLIHFPRDLRVRYPNGKQGKINGAYQQGPEAMVKTVQTFTGLPIHNFVEVNFVGFRNIVDALGGVDVYFERPIKEPDSGLNVPKGCVKLTGNQALAFVRVRKIDSDFGRIARQQLFVSLMMDKVTSAKTLFRPWKIVKLVNLFSENVTTNVDFSVRDMASLGSRLRTFDAKRVDMRVIPSSGRNLGGVSYVIANERQTEALFQAVNDRKPLPDYGRTGVSPIDPADVRLTILNGTNIKGLGAKAFEELKAKDYTMAEPATNADTTNYAKTVVFYKEGSEEKATLVASHYGADTKKLPSAITIQGDVAVVLGADFAEGKATPAPGKTTPAPKESIHRC